MLFKKSFLFGNAVLFTVLLSFAFTGCPGPTDPAPTPAPSFVEKTDDTIANDAKTLGLVGQSVASSDDKIATAEITKDNGKIKITSKAAGKAVISVLDSTSNKAIVNVTVDSNGQIVIDEVTKYVNNKAINKAIKITGLPANQTIHLALVASKDISSDADAVAIGEGKTYATGTAQISLLDKSGTEWNGSDSYYVGIIFDSKIMISKDIISFTSQENVVNCSVSDFEEVKFDVQTGTLTIKNIPKTYTHILVAGLGGTVNFTGTNLIGSVPVTNGTANIKLFAAESKSEKPIDFPTTGEYMLTVLVGAEPFVMIGEEPPTTAKIFMGSATFANQSATVDWQMLVEVPFGE